MDEKTISRYLLEEEIFRSFCAQVIRDFEGSGLGTEALEGLSAGAGQARGIILGAVRALCARDGEGLRRLLYRVDISEKQLAGCQREFPSYTFEEVVAELIVRRVLQKVIIRKKMSDG